MNMQNNELLKENDLILLTIKRLGINGEGIGYFKRLAVFVADAIPEEIVEVKITKVTEKYAYGVINKTKKGSLSRITPLCPYYGKCGGCQLQHIDYPEQLKQKKLLLTESFERYYEGDYSRILFNDTVGMENPWRYRNKTQLPTRHDGDKVVVGMYAVDSNKVVYIDECLIENELISQKMKLILEFLSKSSIDVYNPRFRQGNLRYIVLRGFEETQEVQVTFVLMKEEQRLINILKRVGEIANITSVNYTVNNDPKSIEIISGIVRRIAGKEKIKGRLGELDFYISPDSFFQLNTKQMVVLYELIKQAIKPTGNETVLDCYCGIGSIGLYLARSVKEIRGIDNSENSIMNARDFALLNNIENAKFYQGDILSHLHDFQKENYVPDVLVIDPPRRGIEVSVLNFLQKQKIKKIIYVSCNPATLVKNLNHLQKAYVIRSVTPIDMFPNTSNVESITLLERR
ncbi:MAG TPA: 23S rRNA (uracil(1939)-C(5))-methyltransferase RlmD [Bacilli bacterium]|nr:23S rRNA (uracil(1939)-C(5))-methyltransferase RlmD [Bacilli bacterium]